MLIPSIGTSSSTTLSQRATVLGIPSVEPKLRTQIPISISNPLLVEITNSYSGGARILVTSSSSSSFNSTVGTAAAATMSTTTASTVAVLWQDKVPHPVVHVCGSAIFMAVACISGHVFIYSPAGRR